jgi:sulfofructose kinase
LAPPDSTKPPDTAKPFDVVGVGLNATDTILRVSRYPALGGKASFHGEQFSAGGQMATAMVACARLGLRTKYIGAVGDDHRGRLQIDSLIQSGIDLTHLRIRANCANQSAYIVIDESTGERTVFWTRPDCLRISPEEITPEQITAARLLHIDGHDTAAVERAARIARGAGMPVTVDVDTIYPGFEKVLPLVDYLITSTEFPSRWTGEHDPFRALALIREKHRMKVACLTLGEFGALALDDSGFIYAPAFVVPTLDTTGAGDVFHGAFCYSVLGNMPLADALDFSCAMAALNCTALGARGHIATPDEVRTLLATGQRRGESEIARRAAGRN